MTEALALEILAQEFADNLTDLTRGVLGEDAPRFHAVESGNRVRVEPIHDSEVVRRIPVTIGGEPHLELLVKYYCCWDGSSTFLATDKSEVHIFYMGITDPLFRFEYERKGTTIPGAHVHLHGHRDEIAYLLRKAEVGRPARKLRNGQVPRLAELHLPVGGHRMRPALEDVFLFLKREFDIDCAAGWQKVLDTHLEEWRLTQLKAAVRDAPETAVDVLRSLGYSVDPPALPEPRRPGRSKLFLP